MYDIVGGNAHKC